MQIARVDRIAEEIVAVEIVQIGKLGLVEKLLADHMVQLERNQIRGTIGGGPSVGVVFPRMRIAVPFVVIAGIEQRRADVFDHVKSQLGHQGLVEAVVHRHKGAVAGEFGVPEHRFGGDEIAEVAGIEAAHAAEMVLVVLVAAVDEKSRTRFPAWRHGAAELELVILVAGHVAAIEADKDIGMRGVIVAEVGGE